MVPNTFLTRDQNAAVTQCLNTHKHWTDQVMSSTGFLQQVHRWSEHVQRQTRPLGPHRKCWVGRLHSRSPANRQPWLHAKLAQALSQQIPIVPYMPSCSIRLLEQCCDQHRAWNRAMRFNSCPPSWFCDRFSLACLGFITVVGAPRLVTRLVPTLGVLEKIAEIHLKFQDLHTLR